MRNNFGFFQLEMIHDAGFLGSEHRVVTPDGYILTMHRIVSPNPRYRDFDQLSAVSIVQQEDKDYYNLKGMM